MKQLDVKVEELNVFGSIRYFINLVSEGKELWNGDIECYLAEKFNIDYHLASNIYNRIAHLIDDIVFNDRWGMLFDNAYYRIIVVEENEILLELAKDLLLKGLKVMESTAKVLGTVKYIDEKSIMKEELL